MAGGPVEIRGYCHAGVNASLRRFAEVKEHGSVVFVPTDDGSAAVPDATPVIAGPAVLPLPPFRAQRNRILVQPSDAAIRTHRDAGCDCRAVVPWFAGIQEQPPGKPSHQRKRVLLYVKHRSASDAAMARAALAELGEPFVEFDYNSGYRQVDYEAALRDAKWALWVGCGESQGLALQQAWSFGVPTGVFDVARMGQSTAELPPGYALASSTATPYWHPVCGIRDTHSLRHLVRAMVKRWESFDPRAFVQGRLSDTCCRLEWDLITQGCAHRTLEVPGERAQVHVVVPLYNGVDVLHRALLSVIRQTYRPWRLTVAVNGVAEDSHTFRRAQELAELDARIEARHFTCDKQAAMRAVAAESECLWVAVLDADDLWLAPKLEEQMHFLQKHPDVDVLGTRGRLFGFQHGAIGSAGRVDPEIFGYGNPMLHSSVVMRRELATWSSDATVCDDWELFLRLQYEGRRLHNLDEVLYWRYHDEATNFYAGAVSTRHVTRLWHIWAPLMRAPITTRAVYAHMEGGLGNQLFAAATAIAYARRTGRRVFLDVGFYDVESPEGVTARALSPMFGTMPRVHRVPEGCRGYASTSFAYAEIPDFADDEAVVLSGIFLSARYFDACASTVKDMLQISLGARDRAKAWAGSRNMTCAHVRRGDYLTAPAHAGHAAPGEQYVEDAIRYVRDLDWGAEVVVFSDDPEFSIEGAQQAPNVEDAETVLSMMIACRHHIMSASTLSWWADWYRGGNAGVVVAPNVWNTKHEVPDIGRDHWILM